MISMNKQEYEYNLELLRLWGIP